MESQYKMIRKKQPRAINSKFLRQLGIHIISLLWLGPIITLLYVNFFHHVIGPSVWCPFGKCSVTDDYGAAKASQNDRYDHNTNGVLLFAAKGLEVWFAFVAGLLVYEAQMVLGRSKDGLPKNYSHTYLEFSDILNVLKISKWSAPIRDAYHLQESRREVFNLCLFVLLASFMTLLVNLMGPSTGVLILPSVQSIKQDRNASELFIQIQSHIPPSNQFSLVGCNETWLEDHRYSCAERLRGPELDSMIAFAVASIRKNEAFGLGDTSSGSLAESQEFNLQFLANNFTYHLTDDDDIGEYIVPSRQTLRRLSDDVRHVLVNYEGLLDKSLSVSSHRKGPVISMSDLNFYLGDISTISLSDNQNITCLRNQRSYYDHVPSNHTKCIRVGTGWNSVNNRANFSIGTYDGPDTNAGSNPEVVVYFSNDATYYGGNLDRGADIVGCLSGTILEPCNWDEIFSAPFNLSGMSNITVVEWSWPGAGTNPDFRIWVEFVSYLGFAIYSVEYSVENSIYFVQLEDIKIEPTQLIINPLWILAAWSVDSNGTFEATRFPAIMMQEFRAYFDTSLDRNSSESIQEFTALNTFTTAQAMSLISYERIILNESQPYDKNDPHVFYQWNIRRVWAYGLSTRTSKLGVVVVCVGMVMVVFRCIFALYKERTEKESDATIDLELSDGVSVTDPGSARRFLQGRHGFTTL